MRRAQPAAMVAAAAGPLFSALLVLISSSPAQVAAHPFPTQNVNNSNYDAGFRFLMPRDCVQRCGSEGQYCCGSGQECFTSANIAGCSADSGDAYGIYTTTWTETNTNTHTSTITTHWPKPTGGEDGHGEGGGGGSTEDCQPQKEGETSCGPICCANFQYCASSGTCKAKDGVEGGGGVITTTNGNGETVTTTQYSAPYRPTGSTFTGSATGTESPTGSPTAIPGEGGNGEGDDDDDGNGGGGLSAGAIAGIVIGVLAGLALLGLLCFCCIVRGLWGLLCGGRKRDNRRERERVDVVEERYRASGSRPPSQYTQRPRHGGWFGRPSSAATRRDEKEKSRSSGAGWLGLGAGAATLLALLNLRSNKDKDKDDRRKTDRSRRSRSRYTDSYYTDSPSGSGSGARSYRTRRTGDDRSRYSRR